MPKHKKKRDKKTSKGTSRASRARTQIRRTSMKIKRFKRYATEEKPVAEGSKRTGWKTDGLQRHKENMQKILRVS